MAKTAKQEVRPWLRPIAAFLDVLGGYKYRTSDVFRDFVTYTFKKHFVMPQDIANQYSQSANRYLPYLELNAPEYEHAYEAMYNLLLSMYNAMVHKQCQTDILHHQMAATYGKEMADKYIQEVNDIDVNKAIKHYFKYETVIKPIREYSEKEHLNFIAITNYWKPSSKPHFRQNTVDDITDWIDPFGDLFMTYASNSNQGQFFTPEHICDFMAKIINPIGGLVGDPTSGSTRTILAAYANAKHYKNKNKELFDTFYGVSNDIDGLCAKMSAINMLLHHVPGETICGDGLDEERGRWAVKTRYFFGAKGAEAYHKLLGNDIKMQYINMVYDSYGIEHDENGVKCGLGTTMKVVFEANEIFHQQSRYFSKMLAVLCPIEHTANYNAGQSWKQEAKEKHQKALEEAQTALVLTEKQKELLKREQKLKQPKKAKKKKPVAVPNNQISLF